MIIVHAALFGVVAAALRVVWAWPAMAGSDGQRDQRVGGAGAGGGIGLRWWQLAVAGVAVQLFLVEGRAATLPDAGRVAALWATHAALAVVLVVNFGRPGMRLL